MRKILITGASGFIGQNICKELVKLNRPVCGTVRSLDFYSEDHKFKVIPVGDIGPETDWGNALKEVDCVIHCAGKAHVINKEKDLNVYRFVNTEGTKRLAEKVAEVGVKRLIFLSSIKVNGESTGKINSNQKFTYDDTPNPTDAYSISKFEAEKILWNISSKTKLEVVIVRLPLVYGYGAKGNLKRLINLIKLGIPLPFGLINNQRSLIGINNLVDVLIRCIDHPEAKGKTFLVSDGEDLSTPKLLNLIASAMGCSLRLFPLPVFFLKVFGFIFRRQKEISRLIGSLKIDSSYTRKTLNWTPSVSVTEGIKKMIKIK